MPEKTSKTGKAYKVGDKSFTWTTDSGDTVKIPLRLQMKTLRAMSGRDLDDIETMFDLIDAVAPGQEAVIDEQDVNDFQEMFTTWQKEYTALTGSTLGE